MWHYIWNSVDMKQWLSINLQVMHQLPWILHNKVHVRDGVGDFMPKWWIECLVIVINLSYIQVLQHAFSVHLSSDLFFVFSKVCSSSRCVCACGYIVKNNVTINGGVTVCLYSCFLVVYILLVLSWWKRLLFARNKNSHIENYHALGYLLPPNFKI